MTAVVSSTHTDIDTGLFTPLELRGLSVRNRIAVAPMLTYAATRGHVNDSHLVHYGKFAVGGAGLVFLESTKVDPHGSSTPSDIGLWKDDFIGPLKRIADFIKSNGAAAGIQLGHSGRKARRALPWQSRAQLVSHPGLDRGEEWDLIGPSEIPHSEKYAIPRAMTLSDIAGMVQAWGKAAMRADLAGFDALEIHGAHGYLIHQFLSPFANKRSDKYGGSLENRMRFAVEIAESVRASWPDEKPLFFRVSSVDNAGWSIEDSVALARVLGTRGVDVIDCSAGGMADFAAPEEGVGYGYQVQYAREIRSEAKIRTMAVGTIIHADQADAILRDGSADLVAIGREFLHNPNWPLDAAQKLNIPSPFAIVPPSSGYWLEKRSRNATIRPSTWQHGLTSDSGIK